MRKVIFKKPDRNKVSIKAAFREEFAWLIDGTEKKTKAIIANHPYAVFAGMVSLIIISFVLRFFVLGPAGKKYQKQEEVKPAIGKIQKKTLEDMPAAPLDKLRQMRELVTLRSQMDSVMHKEKLTREDSLFIIHAGETIKNITNEKD